MLLCSLQAVRAVQTIGCIKFHHVMGKYRRNCAVSFVPVFTDRDHILCAGTVIPAAHGQISDDFPRIFDWKIQKQRIRRQRAVIKGTVADKLMQFVPFRLLSDQSALGLLSIISQIRFQAFCQNLPAVVTAAGNDLLPVVTILRGDPQPFFHILIHQKDRRPETVPLPFLQRLHVSPLQLLRFASCLEHRIRTMKTFRHLSRFCIHPVVPPYLFPTFFECIGFSAVCTCDFPLTGKAKPSDQKHSIPP